MLKLLKKIAVDTTAVRESRDFRLLAIGQVISTLGSQAALVALPYQIYLTSHSAALVGLLGAFELGPMIVVSLLGGAFTDRHDRRPVLAVAQIVVMVVAGALFVISLVGHPDVIVILLLGGLLAGGSALDAVARSAIVPNVLGPEHLRSGLAFNYGTQQAASIVGPGIAGLLIAVVGVEGIYLMDAISCIGLLMAAIAIPPQRPMGVRDQPPVGKAIMEGLRFVAATKALAGSFVIDLNAMMFGMPRALFAVLSLTVYHAGAGGTGLLYSAIAVGGTMSVLSSGWIENFNRLGRICIICVTLWGVSIGCAGLVRSIWPAAVLLMMAGWADGISAICRTTISQTLTPDRMRGRMGAFFSLVVTSGPRLGDMESGLVAGAAGALNAVVIGGAGCLIGVLVTAIAFPELDRYEADKAMELVRAENERYAASA